MQLADDAGRMGKEALVQALMATSTRWQRRWKRSANVSDSDLNELGFDQGYFPLVKAASRRFSCCSSAIKRRTGCETSGMPRAM